MFERYAEVGNRNSKHYNDGELIPISTSTLNAYVDLLLPTPLAYYTTTVAPTEIHGRRKKQNKTKVVLGCQLIPWHRHCGEVGFG